MKVCTKCIHLVKFGIFQIGQSLVEAGESYRQLSDVKYAMEDNIKQNFLEPLQHMQNKDLKEVNVRLHKSITLRKDAYRRCLPEKT